VLTQIRYADVNTNFKQLISITTQFGVSLLSSCKCFWV